MQTFKVMVLTTVGIIVLVIGGVVVVVYSGAYDVAASNKYNPVVRWLLTTAREHSVESRAEAVSVPANLKDPQRVMEGFKHFREMCVECHRRPGVKETELSKGLDPQPPNISQWDHRPDPKEMFWVVKNGIRFTAMPAWGASHSDDKLWAVVAFVEKLPGMTVQQWDAMNQMAGPPQPEGDEGAAPGGEAHHHH